MALIGDYFGELNCYCNSSEENSEPMEFSIGSIIDTYGSKLGSGVILSAESEELSLQNLIKREKIDSKVITDTRTGPIWKNPNRKNNLTWTYTCKFENVKKSSKMEEDTLIYYINMNMIKISKNKNNFFLEIGDMIVVDDKPMIIINVSRVRRFEYINRKENSKKFWEIFLVGPTIIGVNWGRIGTNGTTEHEKAYRSPSDAIKEMNNKIKEKLDKGYKENFDVPCHYTFNAPLHGGTFKANFKDPQELIFHSKLLAKKVYVIEKKSKK